MRNPLTIRDPAFLSRAAVITPLSFAGLVAWWKADSYAPLADNTAVGDTGLFWKDQVNGFDGANVGGGALLPHYRTNTFGSVPGIEFRFGSGFSPQNYLPLSASEITGVNLAGDFTIVVVMKYPATAGDQNGGSILGNAYTLNQTSINCFGTLPLQPGVVDRLVFVSGGGNTVSSAVASPGALGMYSFIRSGTGLEFRKNDASISSHVLAAVNIARLNYMGATNIGVYGQPRLGGYLGEICVYNAALPTSNLDSLFTGYMKPKFTI